MLLQGITKDPTVSTGGQGKRWMRFTAKAGRKGKRRGGWEREGERHACGDVDVKEDLIPWRGSLSQSTILPKSASNRKDSYVLFCVSTRRWLNSHVHYKMKKVYSAP